MNIVALVPMKGNSERVPNKNLRLMNGIPLYHYVVNSLLDSNCFSKIVINTDSEKIKSDVLKNFPEVVCLDRPVDLQGDYVSMNKIIEYDMASIKANYYFQTHSTNPLLKSNSIKNAIKKISEKSQEFDSMFSVTRLQTRLYDKNIVPVNHDPNELIRTQDLEPLYEENSNFFIFSKESFLSNGKKRIGSKPCFFELNKIEALDIDEQEDWDLVESVLKSRINGMN